MLVCFSIQDRGAHVKLSGVESVATRKSEKHAYSLKADDKVERLIIAQAKSVCMSLSNQSCFVLGSTALSSGSCAGTRRQPWAHGSHSHGGPMRFMIDNYAGHDEVCWRFTIPYDATRLAMKLTMDCCMRRWRQRDDTDESERHAGKADGWRADLFKTFDHLERSGILLLLHSCDDSATPPRQSRSAQMSDSPSGSPLLLHRLPFKAIEKDFQQVDSDHAVDD